MISRADVQHIHQQMVTASAPHRAAVDAPPPPQQPPATLPCAAAAQQRWIETLAHELRNPLGAVMLTLDMLQPACDADAAARASRAAAEHACGQMKRIIDDVLDLARSGHGKLRLRREPVDVREVVAGAIAAARPIMIARDHRLTLCLPPRLPRLDAEAFRLEQVLTNLLTNAAKFTEPGGRIWLSVEPAPRTLAIRVRDNGIGIPPDLLPHVFDAYRQGAPTRSRAEAGLGIGLTLVRSLVQLMGGSVSAHSEGPGTGAEFIVRLPT